MTRREAWLTAGGLFAIALVVRALFAATVPFPTPEDTAYYYGVARNLVDGRGLVSDAMWSYQTPPLVFPRPALEVWLPLPVFLAALPMFVLGTGFHAAQVGTVIAGALVPVLAWRIAADLAEELGLPPGRARTLAVGSGLTAAVSLPLLLHGVLPDSTTPFTVLALAACLVMTRILRDPRGARALDPRLLGLGVLFGLAALTRNEFAWLGLIWLGLAWSVADRGEPRPGSGPDVRGTLRRWLVLVGVPALVGAVVLAPWLVRDAIVFGSPLPGQAVANALSVTGFDIFAYAHPPTLSRYLAQGAGFLVSSRVDGFGHNLMSVLLIPSFPVGLIGLVGLIASGAVRRARAIRPLLVLAVVTFAATTLLFPVSTTWGTFLHAAGPVHVLLIIGSLAALDAVIARLGTWRGWTNPVAWLGPLLTIGVSIMFSFQLLSYAGQADQVGRRYAALQPALLASGITNAELSGPVVTDFPIWYAEGTRHPALALPDESPADVLALARRFGASLMVLSDEAHGQWPAVLDAGGPDAACFQEVILRLPDDPAAHSALAGTRAYRIRCP